MSTNRLLITSFICFLSNIIVTAQDTVFLNKNYQPVVKDSTWSFYKVKTASQINDTSVNIETTYNETGKRKNKTITMEWERPVTYTLKPGEKRHVTEKVISDYYENGQLRKRYKEMNNKLHGSFLVYYPNGSLKRYDSYYEGDIYTKRCYGTNGLDTTWYEYEKSPEFPGGDYARLKFLHDNIKYPAVARENDISGIVYIKFIISKTGELSNFKIIKSVHPALDKEALRVLKLMPNWIPAYVDGKPIECEFRHPVAFELKYLKK